MSEENIPIEAYEENTDRAIEAVYKKIASLPVDPKSMFMVARAALLVGEIKVAVRKERENRS